MCTCDGILCFTPSTSKDNFVVLWNPSIRKFKRVPPLGYQCRLFSNHYSFGYDPFIDNYKLIVVYFSRESEKNEISVHTLGTEYWRRIQDFPFSGHIGGPGIFVKDTVNWLAFENVDNNGLFAIVSLDLETESYEIISIPDVNSDKYWSLEVLRDCLCIYVTSDLDLDVWIMKEYAIKESWTKLYSVSFVGGQMYDIRTLYIFEHDQILVELHDWERTQHLIVYDSKIDTFNIQDIENGSLLKNPKVYIESLISP
ncbi:putative F-box associated interaction domain-containing protein [Medicago truncatula]|uniref:F-box protein interaction domain protein n=1 Tax=Medicago truncatula TaxID=3880 RepID=G7JWY2_MEDTR|nr:F-box protein interaction domain protein [Medicago truncatula]RHN55627.1 putative F-box associated interaction domain-containing protein [Medicago truncatula]